MTTKRHYHKRVFILHYCGEDVPMFATDAERDDYLKAVGYLVTYGMSRDADEDMLEVVTAGLTGKPLEIDAAYHARLPVTDVKDAEGYPIFYKGDGAKLDAALDPLIGKAREKHRAFVMGAVKHNDGKFGFHS